MGAILAFRVAACYDETSDLRMRSQVVCVCRDKRRVHERQKSLDGTIDSTIALQSDMGDDEMEVDESSALVYRDWDEDFMVLYLN